MPLAAISIAKNRRLEAPLVYFLAGFLPRRHCRDGRVKNLRLWGQSKHGYGLGDLMNFVLSQKSPHVFLRRKRAGMPVPWEELQTPLLGSLG